MSIIAISDPHGHAEKAEIAEMKKKAKKRQDKRRASEAAR